MTQPIVFVDANTVWHRRLAEALSEGGPVVAINPRTGWLARSERHDAKGVEHVSIALPPGWASATSAIGQRLLLGRIRQEAKAMQGEPIVMLTSPAYAPLAGWLEGEFQLASYTADDYRSYEGWGGDAVAEKEREVYQRAGLSAFVSESLRSRAVEEFALDPARTIVSPNATEHRFADREPGLVLPELADRSGPVVGIIGALSERLDLELLARLAESPKVGTFLVAGPAAEGVCEKYPAFGSDRCVVTGFLDHSRMHHYAQALDLALIPYRKSPLNFHASPMRLYDHLATGMPILALEGCDQIDRSRYPGVHVVDRNSFVSCAEALITSGLGRVREPQPAYFWEFRSSALRSMLEKGNGA